MIFTCSNPKINDIHFNFGLTKEIKILHISDLHLFNWDIDYEEMVNTINKSRPNYLILNGDIFDEYYETMIDYYKVFKKLFNKLDKNIKKFFVIGNHELNSSFDDKMDIIKLFEVNGIELLISETIKIEEKKIKLVGVIDYIFDINLYKRNVKKINKKKEQQIIFCHNPIIQKDIKDVGTKKVIVSGHTHKGQIWPIGYIKLEKKLRKVKMKLNNYHKLTTNNSIFISNGAGYGSEKYKFRFLAQNYLDLITIK